MDFKIKFSSDTRDAVAGMNRIQDSVKGIQNSVNILNTAIAGIAIAKLGGFGAGIIKGSSEAAASVETLRIQLKVLTGSAETANALFEEMTKYTAETPFEQGDIQSAVKMLLSFGVTSMDVMDIVKQLGDVSGGQGEKLQSLSRAFGQMSSAGKASLEDVNMMIDSGFNPLSEITRTTGISMGELRDKVSAGEVGIKEITNALISATGAGGRFNGMLRDMAGTTEGKLSNLADAITQLKVSFGSGFNNGLKDLLDKANTLLPEFDDTASSLGDAAGRLLTALSSKLPADLEMIISSIKTDGLMGSIKNGLISILQDSSIKQAFEELGKLLIPKELRESGIGQIAKTVAGGTSMTSGSLLASGIILNSVGAKIPLLGGLSKAATGAGLASMAYNSVEKDGVRASSGVMGLAGIGLLATQVVSLVSNLKGLALASKSGGVALTNMITSLTGASIFGDTAKKTAGVLGSFIAQLAPKFLSALASLAQLAGIAAAGVATYMVVSETLGKPLANAVIKEPKDLNTDPKFLARIEAKNKEEADKKLAKQKALDDEAASNEATQIAIRKDLYAKQLIQNRLNIEASKEEYRKNLVRQATPLEQKLFGEGGANFMGPPKSLMGKPVEPITTSKIEGYSPMQTSRSKLGLGQFYSGKDTMQSMQKITNSYLQRIEKNTKNIKLVPSWG